MNKDMVEMLGDYQAFHSGFQIEQFIVGKQGDTWAKYKQCLREINGRIDNLKISEAELELARAELPASSLFWPSRVGFLKRKIKLDAARSRVAGMGEDIAGTKREIAKFIRLAEKLKKELGEITEERRYELETESWKNKGIKMAAIDILATGRISNQTYDFVFSLPKESQLELFGKLSNQQPMALLGFEPDEIKAITRK